MKIVNCKAAVIAGTCVAAAAVATIATIKIVKEVKKNNVKEKIQDLKTAKEAITRDNLTEEEFAEVSEEIVEIKNELKKDIKSIACKVGFATLILALVVSLGIAAYATTVYTDFGVFTCFPEVIEL